MLITQKARKLSLLLRTYSLAEKKHGFGLQVTCDVDDRVCDRELLEEYYAYAEKLGTEHPRFYITATSEQFYRGYVSLLRDIDGNVQVGVHAKRHIHYSKEHRFEALRDIKYCSELCDYFRFPYLDVNVSLLQSVSEHFLVDSSVGKSGLGLYPYRIGKMWEYPVTVPSDVDFHEERVAASYYHERIKNAMNQEQFVTLLLHPNRFSVDIMKNLERLMK